MSIPTTVIRPVEVEMCQNCRFALHVADHIGSRCPLVWCQRKDCDNAGAERLSPKNEERVDEDGVAVALLSPHTMRTQLPDLMPSWVRFLVRIQRWFLR